MRDAFFDTLYEVINENRNVVVITADHGAFGLNRIKDDFPTQHLNLGISEQNMTSVSAGLALTGKIVYIYSIISFTTLRCFEQINVDIASMNLHINIVGVGAGLTYCTDGPTHHGTQDVAVMSAIPNLKIYNCSDVTNTVAFANLGHAEPGPKYFRIEKGVVPELYNQQSFTHEPGIARIRRGKTATIISSGRLVHRAVEISDRLSKENIDVGVIDVYRLKPFPAKTFIDFVRQSDTLLVLEDNISTGGLADKVCSALIDEGICIPTVKLNLGDRFCFKYSTDRNWIESQAIGTNDQIAKIIQTHKEQANF